MPATADDAVGLVLDALERTAQGDRTLVVCTSDNGGPTTRNGVNGSRNTPFRGSKCETFEGGIRVPLLVRWTGTAKPGTTYDQPVITFDIAATAIGAAGADASATDGVDLRPFLTGAKAGHPHEALSWRSRTMDDNHAVRMGDWKFVHSTSHRLDPTGTDKTHAPDPASRMIAARDMLFDIADEPGEEHDLAATHPEKLAELKRLFDAWSAEVDADAVALGITPQEATPAPRRDRRLRQAHTPERSCAGRWTFRNVEGMSPWLATFLLPPPDSGRLRRVLATHR